MITTYSHVSSIGDYNVYYETGEGTFSGAALLVKDNIQVTSVRRDLNIKEKNSAYKIEDVWVECRISGMILTIVIRVIYIHPNAHNCKSL